MDYIKEAEKYLKNYKALKISVTTQEKQLEMLSKKSGPGHITAMNFDIKGGSRPTTEQTLNRICDMRDKLEETKAVLTIIEDIITDLEKPYGEVLRYWYIDKLPKHEILIRINFSPTSRDTVYRMRTLAIQYFAIALFGLDMVKAM